ncbi:acyl-CoA desaturase [Colwellia sp. MT41]|uniref:acyl-CoA desaturase n=1 Tax=Colwellia sp. MT41 TaxID=58049 RepID=UPI000717A50F|nr:fatty acid desaturase [Colwellia sp. MT41]ALO33549.1 acyl-CoA desaturase [Colwellia sp. MT41]
MKKPTVIWLNVTIFLVTFLIAVIAVPYRALTYGFDNTEIIFALLCFIYCGMSITAGYHRLWSHKTYQAHWSLRFIFALGGAFALQNSILHWCSDHRIHHKHVDKNDVDPYSAKMGFWYSHIGWMCREYQASRYSDYKNVRDLQKDAIVMWQHKYYLLLTLLMNIGIPVAFGLWHGNLINSLLLVGFFRLVMSHHTTFFINSLAHIWGKQTYTDKNTARDNGLLAYLTFGEGYHNYHHMFENDYRNGIRWWQYDPTKWLIKSCQWLGLTHHLRVSPEDKIEKMRIAMTLKNTKAKLITHPNTEQTLIYLQQEYELLVSKINEYYLVRKKVLQAKRDHLLAEVEKSDLMAQYQELKQRLTEQRRSWQTLTEKLG